MRTIATSVSKHHNQANETSHANDIGDIHTIGGQSRQLENIIPKGHQPYIYGCECRNKPYQHANDSHSRRFHTFSLMTMMYFINWSSKKTHNKRY